jgi:hypothetical protein
MPGSNISLIVSQQRAFFQALHSNNAMCLQFQQTPHSLPFRMVESMSIDTHLSKAGSRFTQGRLLACLLCAALLTGCAHRYDMTLTNGARITNVTKPFFDRNEGAFYYKDVAGKIHHVSSGRVVEIKPHSRKDTTPGSVQ